MSRTAATVLDVARAIVAGEPCASVAHVLRGELRVDGLDEGAMLLLEDTLAKGCVRALARLGGWRSVHRPGSSGVRPRRLWEERPAPALRFSAYTFELLRWLVATPLEDEDITRFEHAPSAPGDELFAYLACAMVEGEWPAPILAAQPGLARSALARLGFPRLFAGAADPAAGVAALVAEGAFVLEGVEEDLARRAIAFERAKARATDPEVVRALGRAREANLSALIDACARAERWDLATFMVDAAARLLDARWVGALDGTTPLRDRAEARRAAGAHLRVLARLARRHEEARHAHFTDDGYDDAQLLLARWEVLGNHGFSRAADVLAGLEALDGG